jgi:hypothetical protein
MFKRFSLFHTNYYTYGHLPSCLDDFLLPYLVFPVFIAKPTYFYFGTACSSSNIYSLSISGYFKISEQRRRTYTKNNCKSAEEVQDHVMDKLELQLA